MLQNSCDKMWDPKTVILTPAELRMYSQWVVLRAWTATKLFLRGAMLWMNRLD